MLMRKRGRQIDVIGSREEATRTGDGIGSSVPSPTSGPGTWWLWVLLVIAMYAGEGFGGRWLLIR